MMATLERAALFVTPSSKVLTDIQEQVNIEPGWYTRLSRPSTKPPTKRQIS